MENLILKLQTEAGLTEEQAIKALKVIKDYMETEDISIDWDKFFKAKYNEYSRRSKSFVNNASQQMDDFTDKVSDKIEDATIHAKRKARDFTKKIYDKLSDED